MVLPPALHQLVSLLARLPLALLPVLRSELPLVRLRAQSQQALRLVLPLARRVPPPVLRPFARFSSVQQPSARYRHHQQSAAQSAAPRY